MRRETALRLLKDSLPDPPWGEIQLQSALSSLERLAVFKYNSYEMYQPGRLFVENLALWLRKLPSEDRVQAFNFVLNNLIFVSRAEFQQLSRVLYHDGITKAHFDLTAELMGIPRYKVRAIAASTAMADLRRASLYVGLSDGARIDYFRRQNLDINNEQVIAHYSVGDAKAQELGKELRNATAGRFERFECVFLLDDFCGSGRTDLREVVSVNIVGVEEDVRVPQSLVGKISYDPEKKQLTWNWRGPLASDELAAIQEMCPAKEAAAAVDELKDKCLSASTTLKGAFTKMASQGWFGSVSANAAVFFCPLLITEYARSRLERLIPRLPPPLNTMKIVAAAVVPDSVRIRDDGSALAEFTRRHYEASMEDEHTGRIMFGYDDCGLPIVMHHNTPNNSMYWLWSRRWSKTPLFPRYERHGRTRRG